MPELPELPEPTHPTNLMNAMNATNTTHLTSLSAVRLVEGYRKGEFSPVDVAREALERAERVQPAVNAFVRIDAESALAQARESEGRWRRGELTGAVDGCRSR